MRNNDKLRDAGYGHKVRDGYISVLAATAVLFVFIAIQAIITESMGQRLRLTRYREQLAFDYRVEAYYLMVKEGNLEVPEGEAYGSLVSYSLDNEPQGDTFISISKSGGTITITGYLDGARRISYEIIK
ncbi:hypothetical protein [Youngiibacter fragilis]|uniref:Uncharacterized protein n=1 Tax=Youngiibacter fragilis 232.1 TaxID=994573 RepID=V7IAU8_9CLOT|nr:hypothetical protein [Youngiibacter fragilis]ETA82431.1 hypothetical protein T472_0200980 [Youngiibacter fragilis 232.1]